MSFNELDTVVLINDHPEHRLRAGDLGSVVHVHENGALEVEFVTASGDTEALVTLDPDNLRSVASTDLIAVRPVSKSS